MRDAKDLVKHVASVKAFLAGTFLTATALGTVSFLAVPALSALSMPLAAFRISAMFELGAPLVAGVIAAVLSERHKLTVD